MRVLERKYKLFKGLKQFILVQYDPMLIMALNIYCTMFTGCLALLLLFKSNV